MECDYRDEFPVANPHSLDRTGASTQSKSPERTASCRAPFREDATMECTALISRSGALGALGIRMRKRYALRMILLPLLLISYSISASAARPPSAQLDPYQEFIGACLKGFKPEDSAMGAHLCDCAAQESKSQEVTISALRRETAKIQADPKYKIQDKRLLASFQVCTIETMKAVSAAAEAQQAP